MPGPFTVVTFVDADGDRFPIAVHGIPANVEDAISAANGILLEAIDDGTLRPRKPITCDVDALEAYGWGKGGEA